MVFYSLIIAENPVLFLNPELFDECFVAEEDRELLLEEIEALAVPDQIRERVLSILMEGLAYHQENRYQSADEFLTELCELEERLRLYADNKLFAAVSRLNNTKLENYSGLDTSFLPALCPLVKIDKETSEETPEALVQLLRSGESIYLHGVGGAGKSTALREVLRLLEEDQKLVLYVPLKHVDLPLRDWLSNALGQAQAETFQAIAGSEGEEPVYLLLDGLNELADKRHVPQELGFLMGCQNLCLLLSGRDADPPLPGFREAELLSLTSEQVYNLFPFAPAEVIKGIKNPLICRLYMLESNSGGPVKDETLGGLLSRYVERIMDWERYTVDPKIVANVPIFVGHIAASMAAAGKLSITEYELENSIEEWIVSGEYRRQVLQALGSRMYYPSLLEDGGWSAVLEELIRRLCRDYLTSFSYDGKERHLSFPHETFRDFWCAKNYCFDVAHSSAPADSPLWRGEIEGNWSDVRDMLSDLLSEKELLRLLDAHRGRVFEAGNVNAQWRLFEALKKNRRFDLTGVDFSGLDLRMVSLRDVVIRHGESDFTGAMIGSGTLTDGEISGFVDAMVDPSGKRIAVLGRGHLRTIVEFRDIRKGTLLAAVALDNHRFYVDALNMKLVWMCWSENGKILLYGDGTAAILNAEGSVSYLNYDFFPSQIVFYGKKLLAVNRGNGHNPAISQVLVLDGEADTLALPDQDWMKADEKVLFSGNGRYLFCLRQNRLCRFDLKTGEQLEMGRKQESDGEEPLIIASSFHGSAFLILRKTSAKDSVLEVFDWKQHRADETMLDRKYAPLAATVDDADEEGAVACALIVKNMDPEHFGLCLLRATGNEQPMASPVRWSGGTIDRIHGFFNTWHEPHFIAVSKDNISPLCGGGVSLSSWSYRPNLGASWNHASPWSANGVSLKYKNTIRRLKVTDHTVTQDFVLTIPGHLDRVALVDWVYSPDGRYFAYRTLTISSCLDAVYDTETDTTTEIVRHRKSDSAGSSPFLWSVDSHYLLVLGEKSEMGLHWQYRFDTKTGQLYMLPKGQTWALSPDMSIAVAFYWESAQDRHMLKMDLLEVGNGCIRNVIIPEKTQGSVYSPLMGWSSEQLYLETRIQLFDVDSPRQCWQINLHSGEVVRGPELPPLKISSPRTVTGNGAILQAERYTGKNIQITAQDGVTMNFPLPVKGDGVESLSISLDDQYLFLIFSDGELIFFDLPSILRGENPPPFRRLHLIPNLNLDGANFDGAVFTSEQMLRIATENGGKTDKASLKVQK